MHPAEPSEDIFYIGKSFFDCTADLLNEVTNAGLSLNASYPDEAYICSENVSQSMLRMQETEAGEGWLTYYRVIRLMHDVTAATSDLLGDEIYTGPFEMWIPPRNPITKVMNGDWSILYRMKEVRRTTMV